MISNLDSHPIQPLKGGVIALGCFDGIHIGHQKIISVMKAVARKKNLKTALYLFHPHPFQILNPGQPFKRLFSLRELKHILESYHLDSLGIIPFSRKFSQLSPKEFVQSFVKSQFQPKVVVVGYDFSFGHNRKGGISDLKSFGEKENFEVVQVPARLMEGKPVSTSRIKKALSLGQMEKARELSGQSFFLMASVVKGQGRGGELGYPTANLSLSEDKFLPKKGVYSARVWVENLSGQPAVVNIGHNPTFGRSRKVTVEVHIIKGRFDSLYHKILKVEIITFLREEKAFRNSVELKKQIQKDVEIALNNLSN